MQIFGYFLKRVEIGTKAEVAYILNIFCCFLLIIYSQPSLFQ